MNEHWHAWGTAILRVSLGVIYIMHGWLDAFVLGPTGAAGSITHIGYPVALAIPLAWYLIVVHFVGGGLLVVGLYTRPAALAQIPIMASALFLVHGSQGFFMQPEGGYEYAFLVLAVTIAMALLGPGAASLDHARARGHRIEMP